MSRSLSLAAVVLGISSAVSVAIPAHAQSVILVEPEVLVEPQVMVEPATPEAPATAAEASPYSEEELQKFAGAAITLQRINDDVVPKLESATTSEEQQELAQAASIEMMQAVEGKGMSVDRFQEILWQAQTNPAVAQRVAQLIENIER